MNGYLVALVIASVYLPFIAFGLPWLEQKFAEHQANELLNDVAGSLEEPGDEEVEGMGDVYDAIDEFFSEDYEEPEVGEDG